MTTALFVIACFAAAWGQPFIACLLCLAGVAWSGKKKLNYWSRQCCPVKHKARLPKRALSFLV